MTTCDITLCCSRNYGMSFCTVSATVPGVGHRTCSIFSLLAQYWYIQAYSFQHIYYTLHNSHISTAGPNRSHCLTTPFRVDPAQLVWIWFHFPMWGSLKCITKASVENSVIAPCRTKFKWKYITATVPYRSQNCSALQWERYTTVTLQAQSQVLKAAHLCQALGIDQDIAIRLIGLQVFFLRTIIIPITILVSAPVDNWPTY